MFEVYSKYLKDKIDINEGDLELIKSFAKPKKLKRHQFFLQEGQVCYQYAFIVQGCMRQYKINSEGLEHITRFGIETWWMSDRESITTGKPSKCYIDALEDTQVLIWTSDDYENLLVKLPELNHFHKNLLTRASFAKDKRIYAGISLGAEEKYRDFIENYPDIVHRVPLHMIASYLGTSRETLSRMRKKFGGK